LDTIIDLSAEITAEQARLRGEAFMLLPVERRSSVEHSL
jgi:hypothetical protein